ncbi:hypothetical protein OE88DRAFT_1712769 [Heliocybe sulcata]|uniref:Kri1-like C-terminal domain-containing protein n=1 Tax=Heliocybe sulcata TaxID=5364 RepID=A0A5C3N340_9AGAM|nr:hypothetical protein OE88DRAFT_1712769 [Heliocybe sulcata]
MLSDSDTEDVHQLTVNEHFAKAYAVRKEREELQKLKDKYGSDVGDEDEEEEDSEEMESEDEDGEELTAAVDAAIFKTLARIKNKDPSIYDTTKSVFEEERKKTQGSKVSSRISKKDKSKPITIRKQALDSVLNPTSRSPSLDPPTHVQEQKALRDETISAFHQGLKEEDDEDDLLVPREKTKDEIEEEEEEYREFLQREVGDIRQLVTIESEDRVVDGADEDEKEHKKKKNKKNKKSKQGKEEEDQEFLMNYIYNRGWIDRSVKRLPTYKEITEKEDKGAGQRTAKSEEDGGEDSESGELDDEEFEEVNEQFETSYNFRFEEPDAATIKSYPRQLTGLVRREESTRKEARERRKERKEQEMLQKKEEIKRLKALKIKELRSKLEKIGKEGGKDVETTKALQELDLDADWDPEEHERQMAEIYGRDEGADGEAFDDEKPTWDDDIDIGDIAPEEDEEAQSSRKSKKKQKKKDKKKDEGDMVDGVDIDAMDAENVQYEDDEEWDGTEEMRKKKLEQYMDSLQEMDFNDMVGGMPTRFKYAPVASQNFGLSPAEILMATDQELNQYMGIKKLAPYRRGGWDSKRNDKLREFKQSVAERQREKGGFVPGAADTEEGKKRKRKGKKERLKMKAAQGGEEGGDEGDYEEGMGMGVEESVSLETKPKKRRAVIEQNDGEEEVADGASSKKKRRRHGKHGTGAES